MAAHLELAYPGIALSNLARHPWIRLAEKLGFPVLKSERMHKRFLPVPGETRYEDVTAEARSVMLSVCSPISNSAHSARVCTQRAWLIASISVSCPREERSMTQYGRRPSACLSRSMNISRSYGLCWRSSDTSNLSRRSRRSRPAHRLSSRPSPATHFGSVACR